MLNLHNAVCQLHLNFSSLCKAALLKNHVSDTIKTRRLLRLPFQRQTAQRLSCVNPETAVMSREAQSVGAASISEGHPHTSLPAVIAGPRPVSQPKRGEPLRVPLLPWAKPRQHPQAIVILAGCRADITTDYSVVIVF